MNEPDAPLCQGFNKMGVAINSDGLETLNPPSPRVSILSWIRLPKRDSFQL